MLQVQGVFKSYATPQGPLAVLAGVDLHLAERSSLALMGESGSGKSTLLHLVAGLDRVEGGSIQVGERRLDQLSEAQLAHWRRTEIGLVFQQFNLISSLRVEDNLAFQARLAGRFDPHWQAQLVSVWAWAICSSVIRNSFPAASSNGSRWGAHWRHGRACYWPTNPPATWTKRPATRCCNCCWTCCVTAPPAC